MSDEIQKQTTEGITFRIPSSINQLREESKKIGMGSSFDVLMPTD